MRHLSHRALVLLLPAVFLLSATLRAQEIPSHEIDPDLTPPKNVSKLLDPKRLKGKTPNVDVEMMRDLLKFMDGKVDPNDVNPEMVQEFLRQHPEFRDPKNLERLRDLAEKQMREPRNAQDPNGPVDWQGVQNQLKRIDEARKNQPPNKFDPNEFDPMARPPIAKPEPQPKTDMARPKKDDTTREFSKLFGRFGNSPEMRNMGKDWAKIMGDDKKNGGGFLKDIEKEWKALGGSDKKSGGGNSNLKDFANRLKVDSDSGNSGRSSSSGNSSSSSSGGSSSFSSSSSSSGGGGGWNFGGGGGGGSWTPLLILLVLGVGGFLFYLYYARHKKPAEEAPIETARVWPVDPLQVNSREDVVKAFEFLSISKCGEEAVNWHHLQIADQLGAKEPDHKEAADRLARLYEKARYAPANELFDDMDIAEARARFSQLAGAPIA